ncbi:MULTISPECIES: GbsR/MarR family transcriptional regulator [Flavobacteriaceae]|jgi:DNA-binding transcriptional regulator GbsR (MarR family)|uniref:Transcriptional regulator n=1 Tax=Gaetbulibacter jejuensis TaxID=584607 RepID=A0ABN1JNU9_9FLAO|nr:transcriptional regulator [Meridianimaribacter sp. CL38]TBV25958.1 transcriptional regulator [Meridianimaribacter sp. CL38]
MTKDICSKKMALVEKLGVHLESREKLAPVAARIMSYVILTGKRGSTFDEMVEVLCASKSTISTHLNHLQDLKKIEYFTKTGDRKKYFIINKDSVLHHINEMIKEWEEVATLHKEMKAYKETINEHITDEDEKFDLTFHNDYLRFVQDASASIEILKENLIKHKFNL